MADSDILLFCHKTLESPRSLVEALVCGCPLVGYGSAYSAGLVAQLGGGTFVAMHDAPALADKVVELHENRAALADLVAAAAGSGRLYNEDSVYAHRANLMKRA